MYWSLFPLDNNVELSNIIISHTRICLKTVKNKLKNKQEQMNCCKNENILRKKQIQQKLKYEWQQI